MRTVAQRRINVQIPSNAPVGSSVPVNLTVGNNGSLQNVTIAIQ